MNSSSYQLLGLFLSVLNYGFIFLLIFSALKVNYYNSIVKIFVKAYKPISKISLISNQLINVLFLAVLIKFVSLYLLYSNSYNNGRNTHDWMHPSIACHRSSLKGKGGGGGNNCKYKWIVSKKVVNNLIPQIIHPIYNLKIQILKQLI